jgi:hypothetical protein
MPPLYGPSTHPTPPHPTPLHPTPPHPTPPQYPIIGKLAGKALTETAGQQLAQQQAAAAAVSRPNGGPQASAAVFAR